MHRKRPFDILLISGASGTGKTTIAYELGAYYKMNVVQVDDFQRIVESVSSEADYPVFHYWKNHFEEASALPITKKLEIMISYAETLSKFIEEVIWNHFEEDRPMIIEGDFLSPSLCKKLLADPGLGKRVRCLLITESSRAQIVANYRAREGSVQEDRAELSLLYNNWLANEAAESGIDIVPSRPWKTVTRRAIRTLATRYPPLRTKFWSILIARAS